MPALLSTFPVLDVAPARSRLSITLQENPIIFRGNQTHIVIRGSVTIPCRQKAAARNVSVQIRGIRTQVDPQPIGSVGTKSEIVAFAECILCTLPNCCSVCAATHSVPFELALDAGAPPTIRVPLCSLEYTVTASMDCKSLIRRLNPFASRRYKVSQSLELVKHKCNTNLYDMAVRLQPRVVQGMLESESVRSESVPFYAVPDKALVHVGGSVCVHIVVDPLQDVDDTSTNPSIESIDAPSEDSHHRILDSANIIMPLKCRTRYLHRKPTAEPQRAFCVIASLIQHVRYTVDAPAYSFRVSEKVAMSHPKILDLRHVADSGMHVNLELCIPESIQASIRTSDAKVQYQICLEFFPRCFHSRLPFRLAKGAVSVDFPLLVLPAPMDTLIENPPSYSQ